MLFLLAGIALLALKFLEIGPVAGWSWFIVLAPFAMAVLWWHFADSSGLTRRRAMDKMDQKKKERRERDLEKLGLSPNQRDRKKS